MPRGNRMGPTGQGQMTGRAMGNCAGNGDPGLNNLGQGMGYARGFRRGRGRAVAGRGGRNGWAHRHYATALPGWMADFVGSVEAEVFIEEESERASLRRQAEVLRRQLEHIESCLQRAADGGKQG